ncbi:putative beta-ketoadipyl-CoA thiolase [Arthrobacter globiformis NBRC 12137]|uniref:Putative beta-ketoadipyl-CoA thiolase n=1 Tax=Arthrobacter globiformis (strain ATCC 8010 / DSM 20124 / JCM 1332 / NBRC 12137 / NCIMB 8907 / NRRL B-2979 / 168) TaxID=1077972 RepID=H0QHB3_ARTG1|nr:acetyl-CoA C-acetyltransferase [Arthrobacter globiformis]GAB12214.1 putative beta-ketoadipyl-CoA thiolase [Arthrobacter globiformis NBRC 12137]
MPEAVIVSTARSPIGRAFKGSLKDERPDDLAAAMVSAALAKLPAFDPTGDSGPGLDDLYLGCAEPSGEAGSNMARVVTILTGLDNVPAATVNRFCASSLQTLRMAFHAIRAGEGQAFVAAGVEAVSRYQDWAGAGETGARNHNPLFEPARQRTAARAESNTPWTDPRLGGRMPDIYIAMGQTAENVATSYGVSRADQDEWAVLSQSRAEAAIASGFYAREITPYERRDGTVVDRDDSPRPGVTLDAVSALQPVFRREGTVTAGNACPLNDGAAALVVMSYDLARDLGLEPLARIVSTAATALSPELMGMGPVEASRQALARARLDMRDIDLVELNEAFAVQVVASARELKIDPARLNVHGGAIALGHPFGMTGARMTTTLLNGLRETDGTMGLATLCVGGGQGMAVVLERLT